MKADIQNLLTRSLDSIVASGDIPDDAVPQVVPVEDSRREGQGDYATGVALGMAKKSGMKPRDLAEIIRQNLPETEFV